MDTNKNKRLRKRGPKARKNLGTRSNAISKVFGQFRVGQFNVIPPWIETVMRYSTVIDLTILSGVVNDYCFRANSLFDPDRTSAGHQPLGFDQMAALYNRYHIDKFTSHVEMSNTADTYHASAGTVNGSYLYTTVADFTTFSESPRILHHTSAYGAPSIKFNQQAELPEYLGVSQIAYFTDDRFGSQVITNPTEVVDFHIVTYNPTANTILIHVKVDLVYRAVLHDPILPTQS